MTTPNLMDRAKALLETASEVLDDEDETHPGHEFSTAARQWLADARYPSVQDASERARMILVDKKRDMFDRWLKQPGNPASIVDQADRVWLLGVGLGGECLWTTTSMDVEVYVTPYWEHQDNTSVQVATGDGNRERDIWLGSLDAPASWEQYLDLVHAAVRMVTWQPGDPCPVCAHDSFQEHGRTTVTAALYFDRESRTWVNTGDSDTLWEGYKYEGTECGHCLWAVPEALASQDTDKPVPLRDEIGGPLA